MNQAEVRHGCSCIPPPNAAGNRTRDFKLSRRGEVHDPRRPRGCQNTTTHRTTHHEAERAMNGPTRMRPDASLPAFSANVFLFYTFFRTQVTKPYGVRNHSKLRNITDDRQKEKHEKKKRKDGLTAVATRSGCRGTRTRFDKSAEAKIFRQRPLSCLRCASVKHVDV